MAGWRPHASSLYCGRRLVFLRFLRRSRTPAPPLEPGGRPAPGFFFFFSLNPAGLSSPSKELRMIRCLPLRVIFAPQQDRDAFLKALTAPESFLGMTRGSILPPRIRRERPRRRPGPTPR